MSPLVVCRLLLVFDYLLFQFNEPVEQLTEQVGGGCVFTEQVGGGCVFTEPVSEGLCVHRTGWVCLKLVTVMYCTAVTDMQIYAHTHTHR